MDDLYTNLIASLSQSFDFICISETWINDSTINLIKIDNYSCFNIFRNTRRGGGVSIFVNNGYDCENLTELSFCVSQMESIFMSCSYNNRNIIVGCIYKPPDADYDLFISSLEDMLMSISQSRPDQLFICGDFNLDLLNLENDHNLNFLNIMSTNYLYPVVTKPSRIEGNNSFTLLDNICIL